MICIYWTNLFILMQFMLKSYKCIYFLLNVNFIVLIHICLFYTCIHLKYIYSWINLIKLILYTGAQNWPLFCLPTKFIAQGHVMLCCGLPSPGEVRNEHSMFKVSFCTPLSCKQQAHIMWWSCWLIVFKAWASLLKLFLFL